MGHRRADPQLVTTSLTEPRSEVLLVCTSSGVRQTTRNTHYQIKHHERGQPGEGGRGVCVLERNYEVVHSRSSSGAGSTRRNPPKNTIFPP